MWSNGTIMWVVDSGITKLVAFSVADKSRQTVFDISLHNDNAESLGLWSNGTTFWVSDPGADKLFAYQVSNGARDSSKDFDTLGAAGNNHPRGIWSDGATMWVADILDSKIYAYKMSDKQRDSDKDFNDLASANNLPTGLWSDGAIMWVSNTGDNDKIFAYGMDDKEHKEGSDFNTLTAAGAQNPTGITSDGVTIWVANASTLENGGLQFPRTKVFSFNMPVSGNNDLRTLELSDAALSPPFSTDTYTYTARVQNHIRQTTVTAIAAQLKATAALDLAGTPDPDGTIDLAVGENVINVVVTAQDGTTQTYTVTLTRQTVGNLGDDDTSITIMANGSFIRRFNPTQILNTYDPPVNATTTTLTITTRHPQATIASISPADADTGTNGHQVTIDNTKMSDNVNVEIQVRAKDGTVGTRHLLVRGFACNSSLNIGRVDFEGRVCYRLNTIVVKAAHDHDFSDAVDKMNAQSNWTVSYRSPDIRLIFATRSPDNLTLAQLNSEVSRIEALPWASRVGRDTFASADGDNTEVEDDPNPPDSTPPTPLTVNFDTGETPDNHDGESAFTFDLRFSEEPDTSYKTLRDHAFTVANGTIVKAQRLDPPSNVSWRITTEPDTDSDMTVTLPVTTDCDDDGAICTASGKMLSNQSSITVPGPAQQNQPTNSPASGQPTITGTAEVGETLTVSTSQITDANGVSNAAYAYQWSRYNGTTTTAISGATTTSYTLQDADIDNQISVTVSFTDDDGFEESLTSNTVLAQAPAPLNGGFDTDTVPDQHDGEDTFTFQVHFSEEPELGYVAVRDHVLTVTNGDVTAVRRTTQGSNLRWEVTVEPDGNDDVTVVLPPTTDCSDDGAVCTASGKMLSNRSSITVPGPGTQSQQHQVENSPATGQPSITGTAAVDGTLSISLSSVSDPNGMTNASYSYQWRRGSSPIIGATSSTYTVVAADQGHDITVFVSFTDDDGFNETVTSNSVSIPLPPLTAELVETDDTPANHDGSSTFTVQLNFSEHFSISYKTVRDHALDVENGEVTKATRVDPNGDERDLQWTITIRPNSTADVELAISATTDCNDAAAICTSDGRMLSSDETLTIAGPQ